MQEVKKEDFRLTFNMKGKFQNYLLPLLALIGVLLSIELTIVYYNANFVPGAGPSLCTINNVLNCDAVAKTQFSHFLGIPLSIYGLLFYTCAFALSLISFIPENKLTKNLKNYKSYIFTLASVSILVSIILAGISSTQIHKICILCFTSYFVNLFLLLASKPGAGILEHYKNSVRDIINTISKPLYAAIFIILMLIAGTGLYYINISKIFIPKTTDKLASQNNSSPQLPPGKPIGNTLGSENPKLILNEYTDFECPYCSISHTNLKKLVKEVKGVQVIHHDYPLDMACNPILKQPMHLDSCKAALYGRAAKKQGKFWDYASLLFENQQNLSEDKLIEYGKKLDLDVDQLKKDANSPETLAELKSDIDKENQMGINSTPTYFIGIKKYEGMKTYPELKKTVEQNM